MKDQYHLDSVAHLTPGHLTRSNGVLNVAPIQLKLEKSAYISGSGKSVPCTWLPEHTEAKIFVVEHVAQVSYTQYVVHPPSLLATIGAMCWQIDGHEPIDSGCVVPVLSIIVAVTHMGAARGLGE
jgi:hypothetical protein